MTSHDEGYKLLFSHPEMVRDLLRGFVREPWVEELDFNTLEKQPTSFISEKLHKRTNDIVWRVRWRENWLYIYILIEFQSSDDPFMALRMMSYISLLWQDLVARNELQPGRKLPPVLPIVLYNGNEPWKSPCDVGELVGAMPAGLDRYRPRVSHLVIDESAYTDADLEPLRNLVAVLFQFEHSRDETTVLHLIERLLVWLHTEEQTSLRRAFAVWLKRVFLNTHAVDVTASQQLHELAEVKVMLVENLKQSIARRIAEGEAKGKAEGEAKGKAEGKAEGEAKGKAEEQKSIVRRMHGLGLSVGEIARFVGIDEGKVRQLIES